MGVSWPRQKSITEGGLSESMGLSDRPPSVIDFCLGHDTPIYFPVLLAVMKLLESLPESASAEEIDALFPWAGTRPDPAFDVPRLLASPSLSFL